MLHGSSNDVPLVVGNLKMNGLRSSVKELRALIEDMEGDPPKCEVVICPPATLVSEYAYAAKNSRTKIGGQDCHSEASGPYTGDISAKMLADAGAEMVIVGHSERRDLYRSSIETTWESAKAAYEAGITPIVCINEFSTKGFDLHAEGLARLMDLNISRVILAYEPTWAIGSSKVPNSKELRGSFDHLQNRFGGVLSLMGFGSTKLNLLYGGSVTSTNVGRILRVPNVDGVLVGSHSLSRELFLKIILSVISDGS